nr:50S ribosomal protein L32 [candidate division Zixibacteria bacterium]
MALPKRRHSRTRGRKRRTHWTLTAPNVVECTQCHQPKLSHHICPHCGYYKGEMVREPKEA